MNKLEEMLDAVFERGHQLGFDAGKNHLGQAEPRANYVIGIWNTPDEFKPTVDQVFHDIADLAHIHPQYPNAVACRIVGDEGSVEQIAIYAEKPVASWLIIITAGETREGQLDDKISDPDRPSEGLQEGSQDETDVPDLEDDNNGGE